MCFLAQATSLYQILRRLLDFPLNGHDPRTGSREGREAGREAERGSQRGKGGRERGREGREAGREAERDKKKNSQAAWRLEARDG